MKRSWLEVLAKAVGRKRAPKQPAWPLVWHSLPGNVMEFGNTGWQVRLELAGATDSSRRDSFLVVSPEGAPLIRVWGEYSPLEEAKRIAERAHADREAFRSRTEPIESQAAQIIKRCKG